MSNFFTSVRQAREDGQPVWATLLLLPTCIVVGMVLRVYHLWEEAGRVRA